MFEKVADLGFDRHRHYTRAALEFSAAEDNDRCAALLDRARAAGPGSLADFLEAGIAQNWNQMLSLVSREDALLDPVTASLYAQALLGLSRSDECIDFLSDAVAQHPEYAGFRVRLGNLLFDRSMSPGTTSRARDLRSALGLAEAARDLRRSWHGGAADAVELACRTAMTAGDLPRVLELGLVPPDGEALPDEAAEPEVQFAVAQAALALGRTEHAGRVADAATGFHQALIQADLLGAANEDPSAVAAQYHRAWELAETDDEKIRVWLGAASFGVEELPGHDELRFPADDVEALVLAQVEVAHQRYQSAIDTLRPLRNSEPARRMLSDAYIGAGRLDDAVAELVDTAQRFDNPEQLVRAVQLLVGQNRIDAAAPLAARVLPLIAGVEPRVRSFIHEVLVHTAHDRGAWRDMEEQVRAWINDIGVNPHRRWLLVQALLNQAELDGAWRVFREGGELQPATPLHTQISTALHPRFEPGPESLAKILALCDQFPDDADVRAAAVNAYVRMGDDKGDLEPEVVNRWQALIAQRTESPGENDMFLPVQVPSDRAEMVETFREFLEPQAASVRGDAAEGPSRMAIRDTGRCVGSTYTARSSSAPRATSLPSR